MWKWRNFPPTIFEEKFREIDHFCLRNSVCKLFSRIYSLSEVNFCFFHNVWGTTAQIKFSHPILLPSLQRVMPSWWEEISLKMTHFDLRFLSSVHTSVRLLIPFETHNIKLRDFHDFRTHDMETDSHKLSYESNRNVSCQDRVSRWISFFNGIPFKTRISIFKRV